MGREIEIQIDFTDITMAEVDGVFEDVKEIMKDEPPYNDSWMIKTTATITSEFGVGIMTLNFFGTGKIIIDEYDPTVNDVFYNPDVTALSSWADDAGWNKPEPVIDIVRKDKEFWKYFWETYIVDSDYLDKKYGKRDIFEY